nr:hypothetical protein [Tanacetum cinerariifolium]
MMSLLTVVITSRYPPTNNQLRNSSNPRQQATINNERVTIQPIYERQNYLIAGMSRQYTSEPSGTNSGKQRVIVCYNYKGEGHTSKQYTKLKRNRDVAWFKDKVLLVQAQANGQVLYEEELEFLVDPGIAETQSTSDSNIISYSRITKMSEILTVKLERYKDQLRILKDGNNVDKASDTCAQSLEIDNLKQTLSEHLKKGIFRTNDESRSKMLQKQKDPMMSENKVNTKPVPQTELSVEQAFWSQNSWNFEEPNLSTSTIIVEVHKELLKVNMVNSSLKKLKFHLASFDMVVK